MRFKISEYKDFSHLLELHSIVQEDVSIVKKRGWINVHYKKTENVFSFRRKKESQIMSGLFVDVISYSVKQSEMHETQTEDWSEVVDLFEKWAISVKSVE